MAFLGKTFDESNSQANTLVEAGWHAAKIHSAEVVNSTKSDWQGLKLGYKTKDGRMVFGSITIGMPSKPNVEEIGMNQLGKLRNAIGLKALSDTDQLIGKNLEIKVTIQEDKTGQYDDQNGVNNWRAIKGSEAPAVSNDVPDIF